MHQILLIRMHRVNKIKQYYYIRIETKRIPPPYLKAMVTEGRVPIEMELYLVLLPRVSCMSLKRIRLLMVLFETTEEGRRIII
jgi:hypothetical protein